MYFAFATKMSCPACIYYILFSDGPNLKVFEFGLFKSLPGSKVGFAGSMFGIGKDLHIWPKFHNLVLW